ncbi:MAG: energy-coupling factor transporter transmembrane component T [Chloroflexota bacterium]
MIKQESLQLGRSEMRARVKFGTISFLALFIWSLVMVMLAPPRSLLLAGGLCLLAAALVHPRSFQQLMRFRWLIMIIFLAIPPIFFLGDLDRSLWGITYSSEGLASSLRIIIRVIIVLVAVDGFTRSVDISSIAGLLERIGLKGLGFSMGVAINLLPSLQTATINTWHSLWMRGGLRKQRWRGIRLLLMTIIANALRRTEEIALAAECRAFRPEQSRAIPLRAGSLDKFISIGLLILSIAFFIIF